MRFILLKWLDGSGLPDISGWSVADIQRHSSYMDDVNRTIEATGELVSAHELAHPQQAIVVRADGSAPEVDALPAPGRHALAAYWLIDCTDHQRATEIATIISAAPGASALPLNHPIEVRPIMSWSTPMVDALPDWF
ncbi:hypothetical protein E1211_01200 [Micromonospora sp. 15K316]|uniref:YciI family protein n=1 Tax=Micromonospora sp. 15K316 TaxID=2530376 RepID=UPI0010468F79|nr:hypothetical protein [Micromonospora sp. 15K316]TDC40405.1 hypothetical protein E1211_01200 [Micromonospora sp. 15K316]